MTKESEPLPQILGRRERLLAFGIWNDGDVVFVVREKRLREVKWDGWRERKEGVPRSRFMRRSAGAEERS